MTRTADVLLRESPLKRVERITHEGTPAVRRTDFAPSAQLGLDRAAEWQILQALRGTGLAPEPLAARTEPPSWLITRYVPGRVWTQADLAEEGRLRALGEVLGRLHRFGEFANKFAPTTPRSVVGANSFANKPWHTPHEAAHHYATLIDTPEARQLAAEAVALCRPAGSFTPVLCHRDPTAQNLVTTPDGDLVLLDWEYAGPDDPYFDLAVVIEHHHLPEPAIRTLLDSWSPPEGPADPAELDRARALYRRIAWLWEQAAASDRVTIHNAFPDRRFTP